MTATAFRGAYDGAEDVRELWPAPDMSIIGAGRSPPPSMPTDLFGSAWGLVADLAESAGSPVDYVAIGVITVCASLIGGKRRVRPFSTSSWDEPCLLWAAAVGDPSTNKSPGLDAATAPLRAMEQRHAVAFETVIRDHETRLERARAERKEWEAQVKEATKARHDTPQMPAEAALPDEPMRRRLLVQDATPEAVGAILAGNPFGTLHLRDELAGWLMSFERYSPGGREFWLEAYGGRPHVIDRKGAAKPLRIPFNGVTVLGGIQPEKLADCLLGGLDDGLVPRFLWAWPNPVPFHRPRNLADAERLSRIYRRLDDVRPGRDPQTGEERAVTLLLEDKAADVFEAWVQEASAAVGEEAASLYKGFCGKLRGTALRLALAAEFLAWADGEVGNEPQEISVRSIHAAIDFIESYAKPTALRVFGDAALPAVERNAAILAKYIQKSGLRKVNARAIGREPSLPSLKDANARDEAFEALCDADWLRAAATRAGDTPGRARKDFLVNPAVHEARNG